ncbi:hypothetical protein Ac2012v2_005598 [Leucoagaricus gongylophorus]
MSFSGFIPEEEEEESIGWGALSASVQETDLVSQAIRKEKIIKEIKAGQEGLQGPFFHHYSFFIVNHRPTSVLSQCGLHFFTAMLAKVQAVQKDVDKLTSSNEMLQMYIDNLTKQMAKRR